MASEDSDGAAQPAPQPQQAGAVHAREGPRFGTLAIAVFWLVVTGVLYGVTTQYLKPKPVTITAQGELVIPKSRDGHFYATGTVNGRAVTFMVDTGASSVVISEPFARHAGVAEGVPTTFHTANGNLQGRTVADVPVTVGPIQVSGVRVGVGLVGGDEDDALLGQSFLSKFDISMSRNEMTLRPR
nr:TIGR02281 family clan AA aspartic protease [Rhodoferax sp.]